MFWPASGVANVPDGQPAGMQGYVFNTRRDKLSDPRVRRALGLAFDFDWLNHHLFYGADPS